MMLISLNKSCLRVSASNVTEAERPFYAWFCTYTRIIASAVSFSAIFSCEILDFGQQLSVCVDCIIEDKVTE